ncbi:hypothetical protein RhiirA1_137799 [Rhizophagus irregularis]|uniref:Uncharacterized protein n=1 Tax=Rhizophagus irregularis TaxID=588596 RepID=A0A2N0SHX1_9GLOM|nr:hypothetical protein RhiirA1_137799 [Rhizophagus irregularis]
MNVSNEEYVEVIRIIKYVNDWNKSLFFISNRNKFSKRQTSEADTLERSYKKSLPTYELCNLFLI